MWRITRINEDGSIRIILDDKIDSSYNNSSTDVKYFGYTYDNEIPCTKNTPCKSEYITDGFKNSNGGIDSTAKTNLEKWYIENLKNVDNHIEYEKFCNNGIDTNAFNLKCDDATEKYGGVYELKIGMLSVDEVVMGGYKGLSSNTGGVLNNYLKKDYDYWLMSWYSLRDKNMTLAWHGNYIGGDKVNGTYVNNYVRPVINLKADTQATGEGTSSNPYIVID